MDAAGKVEYYGDNGDTISWGGAFPAVHFRFPELFSLCVEIDGNGERVYLAGVADLFSVNGEPEGKERWEEDPFIIQASGIVQPTLRRCPYVTVHLSGAVDATAQPYDNATLADWPRTYVGALSCFGSGEPSSLFTCNLFIPSDSFNELKNLLLSPERDAVTIAARSPDIGRNSCGRNVWQPAVRSSLRFSSLKIVREPATTAQQRAAGAVRNART